MADGKINAILVLCFLLFLFWFELELSKEENSQTKIIEIGPTDGFSFVQPGDTLKIFLKIYNAESLSIATDVEISNTSCMNIFCNGNMIFAPETNNTFMCDLEIENKSECRGMHEITFNWKDKKCDHIFDSKTLEIAVPMENRRKFNKT